MSRGIPPPDPMRALRSALSQQRDELSEEREKVLVLQQLLEERSSAVLGAVIDALGFSLSRAKAGDPRARAALLRLTENLQEAHLVGRIEVVRNGPPEAG